MGQMEGLKKVRQMKKDPGADIQPILREPGGGGGGK